MNTVQEEGFVASSDELSIVSSWMFHAESIVQQRLNNFLAISAMLFAGIAGLVALSEDLSIAGARWELVLLISVIGIVITLIYAVLGKRQLKFLRMHQESVALIESMLPKDYPNIVKGLTDLHQKGRTQMPYSKTEVELDWLDRKVTTSHMLVFVPISFGLIFGAFFILALRNL